MTYKTIAHLYRDIASHLLLFLVLLFPVSAQNLEGIYPLKLFSSNDKVQLLLKKPVPTSIDYSIALDQLIPKRIGYWIDDGLVFFSKNSIAHLYPEDIHSIQTKEIGSMGCNLPFTLFLIKTKNPKSFFKRFSFSSKYGAGSIRLPQLNTPGFTQRHKLSFFKSLPRYTLRTHALFQDYRSSASHGKFQQLEGQVFMEKNNLLDYKLKLEGLLDVHHIDHTSSSSVALNPGETPNARYFSYYFKPAISYRAFTFLQTKVEYAAYDQESPGFHRIGGQRLNSLLQLKSPKQKQHNLSTELRFDHEKRAQGGQLAIKRNLQSIKLGYKLKTLLTFSLDYRQAQNQTEATQEKFNSRFIKGNLSFISKPLKRNHFDSTPYYKTKARIELSGNLSRVENPVVQAQVLELGGALHIRGDKKFKLGANYGLTRQKQAEQLSHIQLIDFFHFPELYQPFEQKGLELFLNTNFRLASIYINLDAQYNQESGLARDQARITSNLSWKSLSLDLSWEGIKGWKLSGAAPDFSRLSNVSLSYTLEKIKAPFIKYIHLNISGKNLMMQGELEIWREREIISRYINARNISSPLPQMALIGVSVDFK